MTESLQASSAIPLPSHQTTRAAQDPLPVASPGQIGKTALERFDADQAKAMDGFKDYLDRTSITTVERQQQKHLADPVDLILQQSVYGQSGVSTPL